MEKKYIGSDKNFNYFFINKKEIPDECYYCCFYDALKFECKEKKLEKIIGKITNCNCNKRKTSSNGYYIAQEKVRVFSSLLNKIKNIIKLKFYSFYSIY